MEQLIKAWQWIVAAAAWEWVFSGVGVSITGWLILHYRRKPPAPQDTAPPGSSTITQSIDGNENTVAGRDVHSKKETHHHHAAPSTSAHVSGSGGVAQNGGVAGGQGSVVVKGNVQGSIYMNNPSTSEEGSSSLLPSEDDIFLHREAELVWLDQHLSPDKVVAVCGPGGMGKSALAARAVRRLPADRFPDGIIFHTFYHQAETAKALQTIARALHLPIEGNLEQEVVAALGTRQALLILDGAEEAEDLPAVLRLRGQCGVLITTRKKSDCGPLRWDLQALPDEQAEEVLRAWGGQAGDQEAIEQIAELLGGWPVALRLAGHYLHSTGEPTADYLRWLQEEPFKELGESEEHQRDNAALLLVRSTAQVEEDARLVLGLAGTLAYDLLSPAPMTALLEGDERRCRKAINELVNYGLLERRGNRLHIGHALIHEYAARNLCLSTEALKRVATYYIDWCEEQSVAGLEGYTLLDDGERGHCLRLIESCLERKLWQEVKGLVKAIWVYLDRQGWWTDLLATLEMRLTAARQVGDRKDEAWCLNSLGYTCVQRGELDKALSWHEQCLPITQELGNRKGEGASLNNIGDIYREQGKYNQALQYFEQSLSIQGEVSDRRGEGVTLNNIASVYYAQEDYEQALPYYEQCLPIHRDIGNKSAEGITLNNVASIYRALGKPSTAVNYHHQALEIRQQLGDRAGEAQSFKNLGLTYEDMGDLAKAEEYIALAVEIAEQIGHPELERFRNYLEQVRAGGRRVRPRIPVSLPNLLP